jgi:hypothetical protein
LEGVEDPEPGKQPVTDISGQDQLQSLRLLRPERRRLATWLASDPPHTDRDVAGNARFTLFVGSKVYGHLSPRP